MRRAGLLDPAPGTDGRERRVRLSARAHELLPAVTRQWDRTERAAAELDAELGVRLADVVNTAIEIVERRSFLGRVEPAEPEQPKNPQDPQEAARRSLRGEAAA